MRKTSTQAVLAILILLLAAPSLIFAQETAVFISHADYVFGAEMTFYLSSTNGRQAESATLLFQAPEFDRTFQQEHPIETDNRNGDSFQIRIPVSLSEVQFAPFTTVTYRWQVQLDDGTTVDVPEQTLRYIDEQFSWSNLSQENINVFWTGNDNVGQTALDVVTAVLPKLESIITIPEDVPVEIYIYPTSADLRAALRLTGRDWVGAHAVPELGVILVTAVNIRTAAADLGQSIPHELVHFYLHHSNPAQAEAIPAWLNEGLATVAETETRPTFENVLETAVDDNATFPFNQLCDSFPNGESDVLLAYAQSSSLIQYLQTQYGNDALKQLVAHYQDGASCDSGIQRTFDMSLAELNNEWIQSLQPQSGTRQFFLRNSLLFLLILFGFGVTSLFIIRENKNT